MQGVSKLFLMIAFLCQRNHQEIDNSLQVGIPRIRKVEVNLSIDRGYHLK